MAKPEPLFVHDLFPELLNKILRDLRPLKRDDLTGQLGNLRIIGRCDCGKEACGTFYTQDSEFRKHNINKREADLMLKCGANVLVAGGKIVEIETLDPHIDTVLRGLSL